MHRQETGSIRRDDKKPAELVATIQYHRIRLLSATVVGLILFLALLLVNVRNPINTVDSTIRDLFVAGRAGWANGAVEGFTRSFNTLPDIIYSVIAIVVIGFWRKSWLPLVTIGLSMLLSSGAMVVVKNILNRERPPLVDRLVEETSFSFPSGHSTGIGALCLSIFLACFAVLGKRARWILGIFLALLAFAVVCSRLYVGVHWGSDVLAGLTLGATVTCLVYAVFPQGLVR